MGAKSGGDGDDMITEINVTPFVDVMLVLLVMFMITAPVVYQKALKVKLPKASQASAVEHVTLRFFLNAQGGIFLEKRALSAEDLPKVIGEAKKKDPLVDALVSADESLSHGRVVGLIDLIRSHGIGQVGIGVEEASKTPKTPGK